MVSYSKNLKIGTHKKCLCETARLKDLTSRKKATFGEGYVKVLNNFLVHNSLNMSSLSDTPLFRQNMPQVFFFKLRSGK